MTTPVPTLRSEIQRAKASDYTFERAICEFIDNSIDMGSTKIGIEFTFRDVTIPSGNVLIEARFYVPSKVSKPLASAVTIHGSEPTSFAQVSYFTGVCLDAGLAVLSYSKRGCGNPTETFTET